MRPKIILLGGGGGVGTVTAVSIATANGFSGSSSGGATPALTIIAGAITPTSVTVGSGGGVAGAVWSTQGTAPAPVANSVGYYAPTSVPTAYGISFPSAPTTGVVFRTGVSSPQAETIVAATGTGNAVLSASPTLTGTTAAASLSLSSLTAGRVAIVGTAGLLADDADLTFATDTLTTTNQVVTTNLDVSATGVRLSGSNGKLTFLGRGSGADEDLTLDLDTTANTAALSSSTGVATLALGAIGLTSTGTNSIGPLVDSVDGTTPLNNINQVIAAGTAYTMTNAYGSLDFGTTDPILTIANAGTYALYVDVQLNLVGATYATYDSATIKLRRTNNTAADIAGSTFGTFIPTITTITAVGPYLHVGPIKYTTTNTNDTITVQGILGSTPAAGSVTATACTITAIRAY